MTALLIVLAIGFAFSMGAHYTGACMGMPYALHAISARRALLIMAPLTLLGATFASHGVENTVGHGLLAGAGLSVAGSVIVVGGWRRPSPTSITCSLGSDQCRGTRS